ncbi:hypothetical protein BACCIP111895_00868 [Neobacillus rhizosphaerae]|uniref:DUF3307 domain-containing protein n=1 Tax=Neobacillus rhizosphaerae TaxID=2880965 RepID=A0ABM9EMA6_9BACI|nr:DUF3307 domain-containing protein [Neobacillus rhizosphaerae]CAH2713714.1 hypothetical protein BACCIP111895_00868 [Neobacillus rhizosphaerae]
MLILSLILAHLFADFYLQTDEMVIEKRKNIKKHILHHVIVNTIVFTGFELIDHKQFHLVSHIIFPLAFIVLSHYIIDFLKIKLLDTIKIHQEEGLKRLSFFILDQCLHLVTIILVGRIFLGTNIAGTVGIFLEGQKLSPINAVLFTIIIVILTTSVSGHMIRILLGSMPNQLLSFEGKYSFKNNRQEEHFINKSGITEEYHYPIFSKQDLSRGKLIGYIERLLVLVLTFYHAYPAIGFIVAAKSIARFKQMDDRDWAEYFLLGTLTSMFIGITLGIILREALT